MVGKDVGGVFANLAAKHGVNYIGSASINSINSKDGKPVSVVLKDR